MKQIVRILLVLFVCTVAGCSANSTSPQEQLTAISQILAKGYDITDQQRLTIDAQVSQAQALMAAGKTAEAGKILTKVLTELKMIEETDRFNKSE